MKTLPLSEAKMKLSKLVDSVSKTSNAITITKNGRPAAVLVSIDEHESYHETQVILSDKEMMKEIRAFQKKSTKQKGKLYTLDELFETL